MKRKLYIAFDWLLFLLNAVIGYCIPIIFGLIFTFFINRPKGFSYYVPESEHPLNILLGILIFIIWAAVELIINIPAIKIWKGRKWKAFVITLASITVGIAAYFCVYGPFILRL